MRRALPPATIVGPGGPMGVHPGSINRILSGIIGTDAARPRRGSASVERP